LLAFTESDISDDCDESNTSDESSASDTSGLFDASVISETDELTTWLAFAESTDFEDFSISDEFDLLDSEEFST
jgi:hypothetical protein